jgi:hypothetical protein
MANFCTKCGAGLAEGVKFCTKCGAAVGGAAPAATPPAAPAAAPQATAAAAPAAKPATPSGGGMKVVLIVIAVFVGLGILGAMALGLGLWRLSRTVDVDRSGQVTVTTPKGKVTVGAQQTPVTEAQLGVPLYPGSKQQEGALEITGEEGSMHTYVFKTSDSPQQVMAFYRERLGTEAASYVETPEGGMITSTKGKKDGFWITIGQDEGETVITIMHGRSVKEMPDAPTQPQ